MFGRDEFAVDCILSQPQRRGIEYGLAEHDVAAIIEVIREISSQEKGKSKTRRSA
jgi:hypothetical protein